jgi:hypothetical protein
MALTREQAEQCLQFIRNGSLGDLERVLRAVVDGDFEFSIDQQAAIDDAGEGHILTGVDGTGNNAASKVDTEQSLNEMGAKVNEILGALRAAGVIAS